MALVVNTNIPSLIAQRNVTKVSDSLTKSVERLSSGLRINRAMDNPAGLAVSEKLKSHTRSIYQAVRNAQEGINLIQVADGALKEIGDILQRMRELAEQAANATIDTERSAVDAEFQQLRQEIDRISNATEYNGNKLINGDISDGVSFQVGFRNTGNDRITLSILDTDAATLTISTATLFDISTAAHAQSMLTQIDSAIAIIAQRRGNLGALQSRLTSAISNLNTTSQNYESAISSITDADFAYETAVFTRNQIILQSATTVLAQANVLPQQALTLLR